MSPIEMANALLGPKVDLKLKEDDILQFILGMQDHAETTQYAYHLYRKGLHPAARPTCYCLSTLSRGIHS